MEMLEEETGTREEELWRDSFLEQLNRIEIAVDPMARAKRDVEQATRDALGASTEDTSYGSLYRLTRS
jgi:hypothetical protein